MTPADLDFDALEAKAHAATAEPLPDEDVGFTCHGCRETYRLAAELDPSPLCNACAHNYAEDLGHGAIALLALARRTVAAEAAYKDLGWHVENLLPMGERADGEPPCWRFRISNAGYQIETMTARAETAEARAAELDRDALDDQTIIEGRSREAVVLTRERKEATARAEAAEHERDDARTILQGVIRDAAGATHRLNAEVEHVMRERDALRDAVIHLGTLHLQRRRDAAEAWAIRQTANDLSAPFSDERVQARLAEYLDKEPTP